MRFRFLTILGLSAGALACDDDTRAPLLAPPLPVSGSAAYLTVSDPHAATGAIVTVTAAVRGAQGMPRVGAFTARLAYDATGLEYLGESELDGGMRALNARAEPGGTFLIAAGASAEGFGDDRLFAVHFKVLNASALQSLSLDMSELTGVDFATQLPKLQVRRGLHSEAR